jgi:hypothetical protein
LIFNYPSGIVSQPYDVPMPPALTFQRRNSNVNQPFNPAWIDSFPGYNMGSTLIGGFSSPTGIGLISDGPGLKSTYPLVTYRITADNVGNGWFSLEDPYSLGSFQLGDGITILDSLILNPAMPSHYTPGVGYFPLPITVVPEPSSMVLATCAFLFCIRKKVCKRPFGKPNPE